VFETWKHGKPTALGAASRLVAGLVIITPAAGFVGPTSALIMGLIRGALCFGGVMIKGKLGYDDALDAFGVHGTGGAEGPGVTGVFATTAWHAGGKDRLMLGGVGVFLEDIIGVLAAGAYSALVTFVILKLMETTMGLRVDAEVETEGLDTSLHGEKGYAMGAQGHLEEKGYVMSTPAAHLETAEERGASRDPSRRACDPRHCPPAGL